jgi:hypothetical protein
VPIKIFSGKICHRADFYRNFRNKPLPKKFLTAGAAMEKTVFFTKSSLFDPKNPFEKSFC